MDHQDYMRLALELAGKGCGWVAPNPMVGIGTVLADDPRLTCRIPHGKNPIRIICDSALRTPMTANIIQTAKEIPTILATCCEDPRKQQRYEAAGCRIISAAGADGHVDLPLLMKKLGQMQIDSILLEGGGTLNWSALESGIVQKVQAYIAPKLLGGKEAKTPVEGHGVAVMKDAILLGDTSITRLEEDFLIESEVKHHVYRYR